jgi:hypothetical protein
MKNDISNMRIAFQKNTLFIGLFTVLISCSEKETIQPEAQQLSNTAAQSITAQDLIGEWRILSFIEEEEDHRELEDLKLRLMEDGALEVINPLNRSKESGTWRLWRDDGKTEFAINLNNTGKWDELNDDWYFIAKTDHQVRFEDPSSASILEIKRTK